MTPKIIINQNKIVMPNNKRFSVRVRVLDALLRRDEGVCMREILRVVNKMLDMRGISTVRSKETMLRDMLAIENGYQVLIEKLKDKRDCRVVRYRYENTAFSIFNSPLSDEEIKEIKGLLDVLSFFKGFPQSDWLHELFARFDVASEINGHKVVQFEQSCVNKGMENFSKIFHAILDRKAAVITYQRFGHEARKHMVYPYYLKQDDGRWYLVARSSKHLDSICIFSLDRLSSFEVDCEAEYVPIDVDIDEYFKDVCGITRPDHGTPITIRFYVNAFQLPYLITKPVHHSQTVCARNSAGAIMSIHVIPTPELLVRFLSFGDGVRVITSCQLRDDLMKNCMKIVRMYGSST